MSDPNKPDWVEDASEAERKAAAGHASDEDYE